MFSLAFPSGRVDGSLDEILLSSAVGGHRLMIQPQLTASWLPREGSDHADIILTGRVSVGPGMRWLGDFAAQVVDVRGYPVQKECSIGLSDEQLMALGRICGDDGLTLLIDLSATLLPPAPGLYPFAACQHRVHVPRSAWVDLLDRVGIETGITIRVASPLTDRQLEAQLASDPESIASFSQASIRLRQARDELRDGRYEGCVAMCRRVLENLDRLDPVLSPGDLIQVTARNRDGVQRWAALRQALTQLTHPSHHDDPVAIGISWSRTDAEAVLAITASLLSRLGC